MKLTSLISVLILMLFACTDCEKCKNEQYLEEDSLTWNSPLLSNLDGALSALHINSIELSDQPSYRMCYSQSFEENDRFIQLSKTDSGYELTEIEFQATNTNNQYGALAVKSKKVQISEFQWNEFEKKIYDAHFWTLPKPMKERGLDGTTIILEGWRPEAQRCNKRTHQLIARWSPEPGPLRDVLELLISYSK